MNLELSPTLSPAQKAWATRKARDRARASIAAVKVGIAAPSPVVAGGDKVVDLYLDDSRVGCGLRRFVVLEVGRKWVKLFSAPQLATVTVDRPTFDRWAKPARDAKPRKIAEIIRRNVAEAKRLELSFSESRAKQAVRILVGRNQ